MKKLLLPIYYFTLECYFLYFLLFLFYTRIGQFPPLAAILGVTFIGNAVVAIGIGRKSYSPVLPYVGGIVGGGVGYLFGLTPMSAIFCTLFLAFRMGAFMRDHTLWKDERRRLAVHFYLSAFLVFTFAWIFHFPYKSFLFALVILFSLLFSIGRFIQQNEKEVSLKNADQFGAYLLLAGVVTTVMTLLLPAVKWIFFNLLKGIAMAAGMIAYPLLKLIDGIVLPPPKKATAPDDEKVWENSDRAKGDFEQGALFTDLPLWFWVMVLAIFLVIVWLIFKKFTRSEVVTFQSSSSIPIEYSPASGKKRGSWNFFKEPAPNEYLRKLFYQLHHFANKHGAGRKPHETLQEWFKRENFTQHEQLFTAYEQVRYGQAVVLKEEAGLYEKLIQEIKEEIREREK